MNFVVTYFLVKKKYFPIWKSFFLFRPLNNLCIHPQSGITTDMFQTRRNLSPVPTSNLLPCCTTTFMTYTVNKTTKVSDSDMTTTTINMPRVAKRAIPDYVGRVPTKEEYTYGQPLIILSSHWKPTIFHQAQLYR